MIKWKLVYDYSEWFRLKNMLKNSFSPTIVYWLYEGNTA